MNLEKGLIIKLILKKYLFDETGVYHYVVPHCSHCKSTNVTKHDTNWTPIYYNDGKKEYVKVKKYKCKFNSFINPK